MTIEERPGKPLNYSFKLRDAASFLQIYGTQIITDRYINNSNLLDDFHCTQCKNYTYKIERRCKDHCGFFRTLSGNRPKGTILFSDGGSIFFIKHLSEKEHFLITVKKSRLIAMKAFSDAKKQFLKSNESLSK